MYDRAITFTEFPNEIALCVEISGCPCNCSGCSEPWLASDSGIELSEDILRRLIQENSDCSVFGLMGGDADHADIIRIAKFVKENSSMKIGFFSGRDFIDLDLIPYLDFYKIGHWIKPDGDSAQWHKKQCGPLKFPFSNQRFFAKEGNKLVDMTYLFQMDAINDLSRYVVEITNSQDFCRLN